MTEQSNNPCPICQQGWLSPMVGKNLVEHKGVKKEIDSHYSVCDLCGSEQADAKQLNENRKLMFDFRDYVDGNNAREPRTLTELLESQKDERDAFEG